MLPLRILFLALLACLLLQPALRAQDSTTKTGARAVVSNPPAQATTTTTPNPPAQAAAATVPNAENTLHDYGVWVLTFLPVTLAVSAFSFFLRWLKQEGYNLSDALSGCDPVTLVNKTTTSMTIQAAIPPPVIPGAELANPAPAAPLPAAAPQTAATPGQTTEVANSTDTLPRSTSRLIAFMTGITAMVCALSFLSLFIYAHLSGTDDKLQFDGIWKVMAGLGVGTIPYGLNMWKEKSANQSS